MPKNFPPSSGEMWWRGPSGHPVASRRWPGISGCLSLSARWKLQAEIDDGLPAAAHVSRPSWSVE